MRRSSTDLFAQDPPWLGGVLAPRESKITPAVLTLGILAVRRRGWKVPRVARLRAVDEHFL